METEQVFDIQDPYFIPENETLKEYSQRTRPSFDFDSLDEGMLKALEWDKNVQKGIAELAKTQRMIFWKGNQGYIRYPDGRIEKDDS